MRAPSGAPAAYVAFDLEATGLSPKADRVLELGAVRYDSNLRAESTLDLVVDPGIPIPVAIQRLVGLHQADVEGAPEPLEAVAQLAELARDAALIVHGGTLDLQLCRALLPGEFSKRLVFDTLELARILLPAAEAHGLPALSRLAGLAHERPHRALSDAETTGDLFRALIQAAQDLPAGVLREVQRVAAQAPGPLATFFIDVAGRVSLPGGSALAAARGGIRRSRAQEAPATGGEAPAAAGNQLATTLEEATAALLSSDALAQSDAAFEYREEQVQMGRAVAQTLERGRRLLVEAGTGVGKSRGYLVPLALWAQRSGRKAVVATDTVTLQEQLLERDVPAVLRLLPGPLRVALLKGRNHYISLRRWRRYLSRADDGAPHEVLEAVRFKLKVLVWLTVTETGDRGELHLTADEEAHWRHVASDTDDCLGTLCVNWQRRACHMVNARAAAQDAAIVVTNQALLLASSERQGQVLPEHEAVVIDEAHHLEATATEQLGASLRAADMHVLCERVDAPAGSEAMAALGAVREAAARLFGDAKGVLSELMGGGAAVNGRVGITPALLSDVRLTALVRGVSHAIAVFRDAAAVLERQRELLPAQLGIGVPSAGAAEELALSTAGLLAAASVAERVLVEPRPGFVAWLEMRAEQAELHEAPISVAPALRDLVFDRVDAAVLTSATLAVAGSFSFARDRLGVGDGAEELLLASPFDYLRQALCVLADGVPPYDSDAHESVIAALVQRIAERLEGRTLVLFTSYSPLRRVHALLHDRLEGRGIALLGQGIDGTRKQILNSFLADSRTVLLGTNSFWEGIDVPGDHLQCVVIDKLPFAVPTDPLVRARTESTRDPFAQYMLPMAVLRLRQGFGRLIRRGSDRGAVVLCDERLATRDYGYVFLRALPPAQVMRTSFEEVPLLVQEFCRGGTVAAGVRESGRGQ